MSCIMPSSSWFIMWQCSTVLPVKSRKRERNVRLPWRGTITVSRQSGSDSGSAAAPPGAAGRLRGRAGLDEPLQRQPRLDGRAAPRAVADGVDVGALLGDDPPVGAQRGDDGEACFVALQPLEGAVDGDVARLVH